MTHATRQRVLAIVLPALLTGVGYRVFVALPAERALRARGAAVAVDPDVLEARRRADRLALADLDRRRAALTEARRLACCDAQPQTRRLAELTELLARHDLQIVRERPVRLGAKSLEPALMQLAEWGAASKEVEAWSIDLVARYADIAAALGELSQRTGVYAVQLELSGKRIERRLRDWTLVVWCQAPPVAR